MTRPTSLLKFRRNEEAYRAVAQRAKTVRGERTRQPQADLNLPEADDCARGAQALRRRTSLLAYLIRHGVFVCLWGAPSKLQTRPTIFYLDRISEML